MVIHKSRKEREKTLLTVPPSFTVIRLKRLNSRLMTALLQTIAWYPTILCSSGSPWRLLAFLHVPICTWLRRMTTFTRSTDERLENLFRKKTLQCLLDGVDGELMNTFQEQHRWRQQATSLKMGLVYVPTHVPLRLAHRYRSVLVGGPSVCY